MSVNRMEALGLADEGVPPGWNYNPSRWDQRVPIVVIALVGLAAATWLALYQQDVTGTVREPFFDDGTRKIVRESGFSQSFERFPIRDAGLGARGYLADAVTGLIGHTRRWRTMPWIVVLFGILVVPARSDQRHAHRVPTRALRRVLHAVPRLGRASLAMIGPALDEVLASLQYLRRVQDRHASVWQAFWGTGEDVELEGSVR